MELKNKDARILTVSTTLGKLEVQDAGPINGSTAVLWPSLFSDGQTSWGTQLTVLHELGWRTLLINPPGTGGSSPATRTFTMKECAEAVITILDATSVDRAAILGLSWGGSVALQFALNFPQRVSALVLSNTTARRSTFFERIRGRVFIGIVRMGLPGGIGKMVADTMLSKNTRQNNSSFTTRFIADANKLDTVGLVNAMRSVDVNSISVVDMLNRINVPTLVIAGTEDSIFPIAHSEELAKGIVGAKLKVLSNVSHIAPSEAPTEVAALLKDFLIY
ncbi:MAG: alpha/beta hydrolase [Flavobacterium sp.]